MKIEEKLSIIDKAICGNISNVNYLGYELCSQNILKYLRDLIEHIFVLIYFRENEIDKEIYSSNCKEYLEKSIDYVKKSKKYLELQSFHKKLQESTSHYVDSEEGSKRLLENYCYKLIEIRSIIKKQFNIELLSNIDGFVKEKENENVLYYKKVLLRINELDGIKPDYLGKFYIQRIKKILIDGDLIYELSIIKANDKSNRIDKIIAFTYKNIFSQYAVNLYGIESKVDIFGNKINIIIVYDWKVSIRLCELKNYSKVLGISSLINKDDMEYIKLCNYLTENYVGLNEIVKYDDKDFDEFCESVFVDGHVKFKDSLQTTREIVSNDKPGRNMLVYLLFSLNNKLIKDQYQVSQNQRLSNLYLQNGSIPFDKYPIAFNPIGHISNIADLSNCFDMSMYIEQSLYKRISNYSINNNKLYVEINEFKYYDNIQNLITKFNNSLDDYVKENKIELLGNKVYIQDNENICMAIYNSINKVEKDYSNNYIGKFNSWINTNKIDSEEKRAILQNLFQHSNIAFIYGPAGTGKTYLIEKVINIFSGSNIIVVAQTHAALKNIRERINNEQIQYKTASSIGKSKYQQKCDVLIIDESSTISNYEMKEILEKIEFDYALFVGDPYQIESIKFGNWFVLFEKVMKSNKIFELSEQYRNEEKNLEDFWNAVRNNDEDIIERDIRNSYSEEISEKIFDSTVDDEIILCLNYDGIYGVNNINRILQSKNSNKEISWGIEKFKEDDPVIFNDNERFEGIINNNTKGRINKIVVDEEKITFEIKLDRKIDFFGIANNGLVILANEGDKSIVKFSVYKTIDEDEDIDSKELIIPFQLGYATTIHKAQGLEYESVKIVITSDLEKSITHNIFYTAITRSKKYLKIYWSEKTQREILERIQVKNYSEDSSIFITKNKIVKV